MPKYSLNSQAIILAIVAWLFVNSRKEKWTLLRKNSWMFFVASSLFWVSLLGLLYTQDMGQGLKNIQKQLPFLFFPLFFSTVPISKEIRDLFLKYFSFGVVLSALFALIKAFYFKLNNLGDYFYYTEFSKLLDKHTTYFALFCVIAIFYFIKIIYSHSWKKSLLEVMSLFFLLGMLYMLSSRISIVALLLGGIILGLGWAKNKKIKFLIVTIVGLGAVIFFNSPNFQKRFNAKSPENQEISDYQTRKTHWVSALQTIQQNGVLFGAGTGDGHLDLYDMYLNNGFKTGYKYKYNAHNQFLETGLYYGLFGLSFLLIILFTVYSKTIKKKDYFTLAIIVSVTIFMCTESILERHSGIVILSFFTSLFLAKIAPIQNNQDATLIQKYE